ncbi:restriction endonuclease [Streptomyces sp. NPDC059708]|uniref:restriction endonuclease n=1 Tax=Streptomyces sp. NPDC059708 TaxID=3346916 RepID=UPI0036AF3393
MTARRGRRHPVRRPGGRARRRGHRAREQGWPPAVAVAVGLALALAVLRWVADHPWTLAFLLLLTAAVLAARELRRRDAARWRRIRESGLRYALGQLDALHHREFEFAVRDLMRRDGCADARQVGGRGDNGADVKATDPYGRLWVIQCKHRRDGWSGKPVGTPDLHVLNGTGRQVHHGDVLVMLTNGRITQDAARFARSQRLHLVDRHLLAEWATGARPLWDLLRALPPG